MEWIAWNKQIKHGYILIGLLFAVCISLSGCNKKNNDSYRNVIITTPSSVGSGYILRAEDDGLVIITALHVIEDWNENGSIEYFDKSTSFGLKVGADESRDLCYLEVPKEYCDTKMYDIILDNINRDSTNNVYLEDSYYYDDSYLKGLLDSDDLKDACFSFYDSLNNKIIEGSFIGKPEYNYELDMIVILGNIKSGEVNEGISGSAIINEDGYFIGTIIAGNDNGIIAIAPF